MAQEQAPRPLEPLAWQDLPAQEQSRLQRNEKRQRSKTKKRGLPTAPVSVESLWLAQKGMCTCNECRGHVPLEVGDTVIAHEFFRAGKGSPGHIPTNVSLWLSACNAREALREAKALRKGRRMAIGPWLDKNENSEEESRKGPDPWNRRFKRKLNGQVVKR